MERWDHFVWPDPDATGLANGAQGSRPAPTFGPWSAALAEQFAGDFRNPSSLVARAFQFALCRAPRPVGASNGRGPVRCAACDLIEGHLRAVTVIHSNHDHPEMEQVGDNREQRRFLSAVLRAGRGECRIALSVQRTFGPKSAGLI